MKIGLNVKKAESAQIIGDVELGDNVNIWYNATIRGDIAPIKIGNAVIHVTKDIEVEIGQRVTIGHGAILHSCKVEDGALIGMGAIVLDNAVIGKDSMIGAGALVGPGKIIPPNSLVVGVPGKVVRELTKEEIAANNNNVEEYLILSRDLPEYK